MPLLAESLETILPDRIVLLNALTPERFGRWLFQQGFDREVGLARDQFGCPLARLLTEMGAEQPEVMLDNVSFHYKGNPFSIPTPEWARNFLLALDDLPRHAEWLISAHRAIEILDSVLSARAA